ncbi:MFS transporter, putative [Penicillium digitatum PHI26]|uniref:MFS transporter, putative n=2 Tax=Penicillium digitatum TaxID=36651 RepID=K9FYJ0_PEND2|nr:MFS transporter, putative [Penicillium digitatum Pd1]EKV06106.1 MFS transporter, putative [Penicillium digitatum PHI26]EKV18458.1 MFS transporter, putative [Penicillium digitatum Pd1]
MSTETQTETIILQTRASTEAIPAEHDVAQDSRPEETKWMHAKLFSAGLSFFVAGVNDGSLGSIIPYVIYTYDVGTNMVAVLYGTTFCSWLIAALANGKITQYLDLGPILSLGAAVQVLAQVLRVWAPPFALYAVTLSGPSLQ